jgi:hypothetical protein
MDAEELLKTIKSDLEEIPEFNDRINIIPTTGDPTEKQKDVSLIIFGKSDNGYYPRFMVTVNELNE